jgi:PIN domain nuclease of toxin-antitoxin system
VAIKQQLGREDFRADARLLRRGLLDNGYAELPVTSAYAAAVDLLPPLHEDPFDRMLIAQALVEGIMLLTVDANVARYPGPIQAI